MAKIYSKLADLIEKHPKKVILTWIVILLLALPVGVMTMTQPGVLQYDMASMVGDDSESVQGLNIIADTNYFDSGAGVMDPIVVMEVPVKPTTDPIVKEHVDTFLNRLYTELKAHYGDALLSTPNLLLFQSTLQVPPPLLLHNPETQPSACMLLSTLPPSSPLQPTSSPLATQIEAWPQECFANGLESIRPLILYTLIPLCLYLSSYWINVCCCC